MKPEMAPLGVLESLDEVVDINKKQFMQIYNNSSNNIKQLLLTEKNIEIKLHPVFAQSLLIHSSQKYINLIKKNECHLYSLLQAGLMKTVIGRVTNVVINLKKENILKEEVSQISLIDFIKLKTKVKCQNSIEIASLFTSQNIKLTMNKLSFPIPRSEKNCKQILNDWYLNFYTPHLCGLKEKVSKGLQAKKLKKAFEKKLTIKETQRYNSRIKSYEKIKDSTTLFQRSYIDSLCNNLGDQQNYCSSYLMTQVWDKVINAEKPKNFMSYICNDLYPSRSKGSNFLNFCRNEMIATPQKCQSIFNKEVGSFLPHPDCNIVSESLNESRLKTEYQDCPSKVDNESVTNIHRLVSHFSKEKGVESKTSNCQDSAITNFAKMNIKFENEIAWPLKLCYRNKFEDKTECQIYIPGSNQNEPLSEVNVVSNIINKQLSLDSAVSCELVSDRKYKPNRLKYKTGCFITYKESNCTLLECDKKVIINEKAIELIQYKGKPNFEYVTSSFANEKFSQNNVLKETYKLNSRNILNLTILKSFLKQKGNGVIHGVGCVEDLMPRFFKRENLQQCTPHPFIIDGVKNKGSDSLLVFRSSIDNVHLPRLIRWQNIFNAVANFRELHPLRRWVLIGLTYAAK